jgi:hypothetical protein
MLVAGAHSTITRPSFSTMHTDRTAALALVAGSVAGLVTMLLHPTGHDVVRNATAGGTNALNTGVHALALLAQPLVLGGALALVLRLRARRDLAIGAYVFFAMASVAVIIAAAASGFIAPAVVRRIGEADAAARAGMMGALGYTGMLNQAFARIHVMFSSVAILLWSIVMLAGRELSRALATFGIVLGAALLAGVLTGALRLDIHGFGLVVLGQGAWFGWVAWHLWRQEQFSKPS